MGIVEQYLLQLKNEKCRWRRAAAILTVLSLLVAIGVSWNLRMTGITIANGATCGQEEHRHTESCPMEKVLICGYDDETVTEDSVEVPTTAPAEIPAEDPREALTEAYEEVPAQVPAEVPAEAMEETQEETVLDVVMNAAADVFSGFAPVAHAEELPAQYQREETMPGHVHTDACYEVTWLCGIQEHIHVLSCYADTTADIESAVIWEADLPELTDVWADDLAGIAQSQLGCGESARNYIVADDGQTRNGITRYGQWYGNPYGDWSAMFIMFCLNYAEIPEETVPRSPGVYNMMRLAEEEELFLQPDEALVCVGNLLFLDTDDNSKADRIAVVTAYDEETGNITVISGDWDNKVAEIPLAADDPMIMGYIDIQQVQECWELWKEETVPVGAAPMDETLPGATTTEPSVSLDVEFPEEGIMRITARTANMEEVQYIWQWQVSEYGNDPWTDIAGATGLVCELEDTEENLNRYYRLRGQKAPVMRMFAVRAAETEADSQELFNDNEIILSEPIAPFRIDRNGGTYTIDVYAIAVDETGKRIEDLDPTDLGSFEIDRHDGRITAESRFQSALGEYVSAYFGTETRVEADNIASVSVNRSSGKYILRYRLTGSNSDVDYLSNAESTSSLYLRYKPIFTVTFVSEGGFTPLTEKVPYNGFTSLTEPLWSRDGYKLLGWTVNGDEQHVYTFDEIVAMPVKENVTYTAKWANEVTVSFHLGKHTGNLYAIEPMVIPYGSTISPLPSPIWKTNVVAESFDGWHLNEDLTQPIPADYTFLEDTILYAKWSPKEDGYYVYFMDFQREGQVPLVLVTASVTEGKTVSPYTPGNAPSGKEWNGTWYLNSDCTNAFSFSIPVSAMTDYLTGANRRDLYLYPGTQSVCRAIFVTYGTKVDPVTVPVGGAINLSQYRPERTGFEFAGWTLKDGTSVSGVQILTETTTFIAKWEPAYVPFEAILRIENANDTGLTQADILGTWYAKAGSQIRVKSTYTGEGNNRTGNHEVVCVVDGKEYPVYKDAALNQKAMLSDVYSTYFLYNNSGTNWKDEVNWDDIYTGGELPYSTRPVSSAGDTIINFDYMRVRNDIVFTIPNTNSSNAPGAYIDLYKLQQNGLITGSVIYDGTKPTKTGQNVSAHGVSADNIRWSYEAAGAVGAGNYNYYTLHDMKYGQRIYEVYPVGGSWLTTRNSAFHWYETGTSELFSSRREDLSADFFTGSGRKLMPTSLTAVFANQDKIALMYAIECLPGEKADFTIDNIGYKVQTQLCEVVNHTGNFTQKELLGCEKKGNANYTSLSSTTSKLGGTSVRELFGTTYWDYYKIYDGVSSLSNINKAYIFYYTRLHMNIQFNFGYDANGNGATETEVYENIPFGTPIAEYRFAMPDHEQHPLLNREGYEFAGWLDSNGFVLEEEDWGSMVATGDSENNTMIFIAKWEKISNNIVEYYEDRSSAEPFESHYFDDGELVQYPTMTAYPAGWVWQEYGEGQFQRFDWDVPMYGEYGVQEIREIGGEEQVVNVIRIYGTWDDAHTKVVYDPNAPQGGIPGTVPTDSNEYTIWQSEVPVASRGDTANADPEMVFVGWMLDRNGIVYQPGDHVPVQWPRTMIFTAQWAKPEEVVYLRYDPNGGTPEAIYPDNRGFTYKKNATAAVWDNTSADGADWFSRNGAVFAGWNTERDGSGTAYAPGSSIVLTAPVTTLYAQWEKTTYNLSVYKEDAESNKALAGAEFGLYRQENGMYLLVQSLTTAVDGHIIFSNLETDTLYKLVEENPPNGYTVIAKEVFFALRPNGNSVSLRFYDSAGKEISAPNGISAEYNTGSQLLTVTVKNLRGYELPSTGGSGMFFNILCGLFLVSAPLVYGLGLRRNYRRRFRK